MLLIAGMNFVNLSTAGAAKRAKEVGVKKLMGSERRQLISQFLTESFVITGVAAVFALGIAAFNLPLFNQLSGKELTTGALFAPRVLLYVFWAGLALSLLAGTYPAAFIASFKPIDTLKSKFAAAGKSKGIRSGLVVFQFVLSAGLIIVTLVVDQ
ncbi:MAG: FtsX-like permease family protein, partial [Pseudomonadota bacterium]